MDSELMTTELDGLRLKIDDLDRQLLTLLAERRRIVLDIGRFKKANRLAPRDSARWKAVLAANRARGAELDLCPEFVEALYHLIHEYSVELERDSD